jgi:hypothetical protein
MHLSTALHTPCRICVLIYQLQIHTAFVMFYFVFWNLVVGGETRKKNRVLLSGFMWKTKGELINKLYQIADEQ